MNVERYVNRLIEAKDEGACLGHQEAQLRISTGSLSCTFRDLEHAANCQRLTFPAAIARSRDDCYVGVP